MRRLGQVVGVVALGLVLSGCPGWIQPGFHAGQSRWNSGEKTLTAVNVDDVVQLWDAPLSADFSLSHPISSRGTIYLTSSDRLVRDPGQAIALDARTGATKWSSDLVVAGSTQIRPYGPVLVDDDLVAPYDNWDQAGNDGLFHVDTSDGVVTAEPLGQDAWHVEPIVSGDDVLISWMKSTNLGEYDHWLTEWSLDWGNTPTLGQEWRGSPPVGGPGAFAIVGDRLVWSWSGTAFGFAADCLPNFPPPASGCRPAWTTYLAGTGTIREVAAVDTDSAAYVDTEGLISVLNTATGSVEWTAQAGSGGLVVADGTIFTTSSSGQLSAVPASGCGASGCQPEWTAESGAVQPTRADPVAASNVVYVPAGNRLVAFPAAGCGAATCTPLASIDVGHMITGLIVDSGRIVVTTDDSHVVAFGLPGELP